MTLSYSLTPLSDAVAATIRKGIIEYWNEVASCDDLGEVPGDLVHDREVKVAELLLTGQVSDVYEASRLTAEFECMRRLLES
jgi:hypothetical protein